MKARNTLQKALVRGALTVLMTAAITCRAASPVAAQPQNTGARAFGPLTLGAGHTARLNAAHRGGAEQGPQTVTLAFDLFVRDDAARDEAGDPNARLVRYRFLRRVSRQFTLAPGESASFDYTNPETYAVQLNPALEVAGIDTSPTSTAGDGGEVSGIDTSPVITALELLQGTRLIAVLSSHP